MQPLWRWWGFRDPEEEAAFQRGNHERTRVISLVARGTRKGIADRVGQGTEGEGQVGRLTFSTMHFTNKA